MGTLSPVLRSAEGGRLIFFCPGCQHSHTIQTGDGPGPRWSWNGDPRRPVFSPSVLVTGRDFTPAGEAAYEAWCDAGSPQPAPDFESADVRCHSFVGCNGAAPGQIVFLSDCTHALAGAVVDLPEKWA